ncbi:hypothetical protein [Lentzea sp. HUAS12]|uniref:hypothetical protein n=1 Tax=Lentzea sp. HUAS12 TaxID=2951806 RepID=UPI0020A1E453|nr:hypothetical protein [Lentzea sp. HUAS12]USX56221.1 hypothetical protein ND450_19605 [Lentzea sp. HUAS12]
MKRPKDLLQQVHNQVWDLVKHLWAPNAAFGHGTDHAHRAYAIGMRLAEAESADPLPVGAACYLMDAGLDLTAGRRNHIARGIELAREVCAAIPALGEVSELVYMAVAHHEADNSLPPLQPPEVLVVRDSDTLDRMGSSGVRMTLTYGTWIKRPLHHPGDPCCEHRKPQLDSFTLDYVRHLYSLKDAISTQSGRALIPAKLAEQDAFITGFRERWERLAGRLRYVDGFDIVDKLDQLEPNGAADRIGEEYR